MGEGFFDLEKVIGLVLTESKSRLFRRIILNINAKKQLRVLALVQLPPPIHGASEMNKRVVNILSESPEVKVELVRLNYARSFHEMHDSDFKKIIYSAKATFRFLIQLFASRPHITYIAFSPFGSGFYRDLVFVVMTKLFGSKPYLHLHGTGLSSSSSRLKKSLLKLMFNGAKLIIISESLRPDIAEFSHKADVTVIDNCVDDFHLASNRQPMDRLRVLYLANLDERKGVKKSVEIFSEIRKFYKNVDLTIAGADTFFLTQKSLREYIDNRYPELAEFVDIVGPVYGAQKHELFCKSDIFLYPTSHDAAPLVILEALSHGLPVVCSSQGALPDMVCHGRDGFICNSNRATDYANFFNLVAKDLSLFSNHARNSYLERYSPIQFEKMIKKEFFGNDQW